MGGVQIARLEDAPWGQPAERSFDRERGTRIHIKFLGERGKGPWVLWTRYEPNHTQVAHSHDEDEVIYVMEGEVAIGGTRCGPGTAVFVKKGTTYGPLVAGPQGAVFLRATPEGLAWG